MSGFVCRECSNQFIQDPLCVTCGAQKLYDNTVAEQAIQIERLTKKCEQLMIALMPFALAGDPHSIAKFREMSDSDWVDDGSNPLTRDLTVGYFHNARKAVIDYE